MAAQEEKNKSSEITIVHVSDLHVGSQYFIPSLIDRAIEEINEIDPLVIVATGDLTDEGFKQEYKTAKVFFDALKCKNIIVTLGNHDSRNVGYLHFEDLFGPRDSSSVFDNIVIACMDSSEPDLDSGRIGRERYGWLEEKLSGEKKPKIFALHHHLIPVPGTGRERNTIYDAGDLLEVIVKIGVDVVLCGHKHVPYVWHFENLVMVNAGTLSSLRLRGFNKPCYNVLKIKDNQMSIYQKYPFSGEELVAEVTFGEKKLYKSFRSEKK